MRALPILACLLPIGLLACSTTTVPTLPADELLLDCRDRFLRELVGDPAIDLLSFNYALSMCDGDKRALRGWRDELRGRSAG